MKNYKNIFVKKKHPDDRLFHSYNNSDLIDGVLYINGEEKPYKVGTNPAIFDLNKSIEKINNVLNGVSELLIE